MARETVGLKIAVDSSDARKAAGDLDALDLSAENMARGMRIGAAAIVAVGAAAVAAGAAVLAFTLKIAEQADEAIKNARALGLTAAAYQELDFALEISGSSMDTAGAAFRRLARVAADAQDGISIATDAFDDIGVSAVDASGNLRSIEDLVMDIADGFYGMADGTEKAALAQVLLGRSGAQLTTFLNQGSDAIRELREEAVRYGVVMSTDVALASEQLNDDMLRLKTAANGLAQQIAVNLIPQLRNAVGGFVDLIGEVRLSEDSINSLSGPALDALLAGLISLAQASIAATRGVLSLRAAYEAVMMSANGATQRVDQFGDAVLNPGQEIEAHIRVLDELSDALDGVSFAASTLGFGGMFAGFGEQIDRAVDRVRSATDYDVFRPVRESAEAATSALEDLTSAMEVGFSAAYARAIDMSRKMGESMRAEVEIAKELRALAGERKTEGNEKLLESLRIQEEINQALIDAEALAAIDARAEKYERLGQLGSQAFGGLMTGLKGLGEAAFWEKDGDALKEFGKSLGQMLVNLGTMAIAYAAVAALGAVFPALIPLVGKPTAAPALAAAGVASIAAGAALGAATRGPSRGVAQDEDPSTDGPTTTNNVYNVTFDSLTPARSRNRAMVESLGSSIDSAV